MNDTNEFLSRVLLQGKRALAAYASNALLQSQPAAAEGFGPDPLAGWQDWLAGRVEELAAAAAANEPTMFARQIQWARAALASRGIPPEHFRAGLKSLREVLAAELPEAVRPTAEAYVDRALDSFDEEPEAAALRPETPQGRRCSQYLVALLGGDLPQARRLVDDALDQGSRVPDIYLEILLPAQQEIGRMWLGNEVSVAEEHFVSQATRKIMAGILPRATFRPPNGKTFLAAAVDGNQHDIGLQAVADFFEMDGWRTIYLGASVPARDIIQAIRDFDADLLGLSASQSVQLPALRTTLRAVRDADAGQSLKILAGGRALADAPGMPEAIGADGYAANPLDAVRIGNELVAK